MATEQLRLFDPPKPLLERFGPAFFRNLPQAPGIYRMLDGRGRVLYVGQSGNLRVRVSSYKRLYPDRAPRKMIRLIHAVEQITWELCASASAARLRETELLRKHRPRFNTINPYPKAYPFIGIRDCGSEMTLSLALENGGAGEWYGAFKGAARAAYGALLRLLWAGLQEARCPADFPPRMCSKRPPREFTLSLESSRSRRSRSLPQLVSAYLAGESSELLEWVEATLPEEMPCRFQQQSNAFDLELLTEFFERGPRRNAALRDTFKLPTAPIEQEQLDTLLWQLRTFNEGLPL